MIEKGLEPAAWVALEEWHQENGQHDLAWRKNPTPWRILVAEVLLHRTRMQKVAVLYPAIAAAFKRAADVVAQPDEWHSAVRRLGLRWRSEAFVRLCEVLEMEYNGRIPDSYERLMSLPGIGQYAASAVRVFGFGATEPLVETNTLRVAGRVTGDRCPQSRHRTAAARRVVSQLFPRTHPADEARNYAVLDLGLLVCQRNPSCHTCPLRPYCQTGLERTGP